MSFFVRPLYIFTLILISLFLLSLESDINFSRAADYGTLQNVQNNRTIRLLDFLIKA